MEPVAPEAPLSVIGDVHGRLDLLERAVARGRGQLICVGDYVDRGPDSAGVLRLLQSRPDVICLGGNHEDMLLDFLDDPLRAGPRWLRYGGVETLQSYGVLEPKNSNLEDARDMLRAGLGPQGEAWLRALPSLSQSGNVVLTHAGADPRLPMDQQSAKTLRWGHPKFGQISRRDGLWVLRGHVVQDEALMQDGTIQIDTGAWHTGRLTLAHIAAGQVDFEEISL